MPRFNIFNPTLARRIIYDGSPEQRRIEIPPGETRHNVAVEPHIAAGFGDGADGNKSDLWFIPVGGQTSPPPVVEDEAEQAGKEAYSGHTLPETEKTDERPVVPQPEYKRYQAPLTEDPFEKEFAEDRAKEEAPVPKPKHKKTAHKKK
jgi:hypothetical protein